MDKANLNQGTTQHRETVPALGLGKKAAHCAELSWNKVQIGILNALCLVLLLTASGAAAEKLYPYEQKLLEERQKISAAYACTDHAPDDAELFARAMRDYWHRAVAALWDRDRQLNAAYPAAQGAIRVTDQDCGLVRNAAGGSLRIGRDTCLPWKIADYPTLPQLAERLKAVPALGAEQGFADPGSREGGWIYDTIVRELLRGEPYPPEGKPLYLPEHHGNAGFGVLFKRGNAVRWYGPDCCVIMRQDEAEAEAQRKSGHSFVDGDLRIGSKSLPDRLKPEELRYLRVRYREVDFNLNDGQGGVHFLGRGELGDFKQTVTEYYLVSPCGAITCVRRSGPCSGN